MKLTVRKKNYRSDSSLLPLQGHMVIYCTIALCMFIKVPRQLLQRNQCRMLQQASFIVFF